MTRPPRIPQPLPLAPGERRAAPRLGTRLRGGRLLSHDLRFVAEAQIRDVSAAGMRLALASPPPVGTRLRLFDSLTRRVAEGRVAWRAGKFCGLQGVVWTDAAEFRGARYWRRSLFDT